MNRRQRRDLNKKRKQSNAVNYSANMSASWTTAGWKPPKEEPEKMVPGVNCPPTEEEFEKKVNANIWHDREEFDTFIAKIKSLSNENDPDRQWCWAYNSECKYLDIRIDMRDGGFILTNRTNKRINLAQLEWQYESVKP